MVRSAIREFQCDGLGERAGECLRDLRYYAARFDLRWRPSICRAFPNSGASSIQELAASPTPSFGCRSGAASWLSIPADLGDRWPGLRGTTTADPLGRHGVGTGDFVSGFRITMS